jgi:hypothetical protein
VRVNQIFAARFMRSTNFNALTRAHMLARFLLRAYAIAKKVDLKVSTFKFSVRRVAFESRFIVIESFLLSVLRNPKLTVCCHKLLSFISLSGAKLQTIMRTSASTFASIFAYKNISQFQELASSISRVKTFLDASTTSVCSCCTSKTSEILFRVQ